MSHEGPLIASLALYVVYVPYLPLQDLASNLFEFVAPSSTTLQLQLQLAVPQTLLHSPNMTVGWGTVPMVHTSRTHMRSSVSWSIYGVQTLVTGLPSMQKQMLLLQMWI